MVLLLAGAEASPLCIRCGKSELKLVPDLDVSLSEFSGVSDDDDVFDIDKDAGQNANLDLARVYIEMDDPEAARELLEEVMDKGSDNQKAEAESLLKTLSA